MRKIRVLIVDDSVVVRKIVSDSLSVDPEIEIAGLAANGKIGLAKIQQVNPDVVTMDIEMPEMDGLQALAEIRKIYPKLPVIMFSTLTERGGEKTLEALALGATDYVTKPANVGSVSIAMQRVRDELIPKIKSFCSKAAGIAPPVASRPAPMTTQATFQARTPQTTVKSRIDIIAIGVSTGGPNALAELFPALDPAKIPVPIVITQHMPPYFTKLLAERLSSKSRIPVKEGAAGETLKPGEAWIAPGDYHMCLERKGTSVQITTNQNPPENSCRPAVDVMLRSVVEIYGAHTLGVILTGMGQDGLIGCQQIKKSGGQVVAQDEETSVVWGMPGFVTKDGLADKVMPLQHIAGEIMFRLKYGR
ncbi:MAG: chemotaxis response regulator protein-glutamate methylesterase [Candidatus Nitrohelix vancouverensis]|uniref:Protein-glutamate methylesterase/protein-glutamine glutaminase n=1 Tax=Candidatus Nitrohelix vancouverensis TaxID=2705534 RepID=A0A7T0C370_9BACT|nr:MAG: chemotaxis response regulator protein-glutamate methylesterase [Candidatus Nitrohelix vancouverensis]